MSVGLFKKKYEIMKQAYDELYKTCIEQNSTIVNKDKEIIRLKEELRQSHYLIGLYEACISKGVKIDFPNSDGKGGNTANTGKMVDVGFDGETTVDFDDF